MQTINYNYRNYKIFRGSEGAGLGRSWKRKLTKNTKKEEPGDLCIGKRKGDKIVHMYTHVYIWVCVHARV